MKKIIAATLAVMSVTCATAAVACSDSENQQQEPNYYTFTYQSLEGFTFDFDDEVVSGAKVKEGYVIKFKCSQDDSLVGEPAIKVNGEQQYPDKNGYYSITVNGNVSLTVDDVYKRTNYTVTFDKGDNRITFLNSDGSAEMTSLNVEGGTAVKFKINASVYYKQTGYSVLSNTTVLEADSNGVYTTYINGQTTISVTDLELEDSFLVRENGGSGTVNDPFIVERPIDLYVLADRVNDEFWNGYYAAAYYKMTADIDMEGEQLYIIGDNTVTSAFFYGQFDGNGHTISNYYISPAIIEQENYTTEFLTYIGLFGRVSATTSRTPVIKGVNLKNFTITVPADEFKSMAVVGGLVGWSVGAEISNCTAEGTITVDADNSNPTYVGGLVGFQQSASSGNVKKFAPIINCSTNVTINGESGFVYAAGGISGYVTAYEETVGAYIINCYSTGDVVGAVNAGGIAGLLNPYTSIKNCYSTGDISAYSGVGVNAGVSTYAYANGGGIAGYVDCDSIITNCFSTGKISADSTMGGSQYKRTGAIAGVIGAADSSNVASYAAYVQSSNVTLSSAQDAKTKLGWSENDWIFTGSYPTLRNNSVSYSFDVTLDLGSNNKKTITLNAYKTISEWYDGGQIDEYFDNGSLRSYGYYFDSQLTNRVPIAYVFTGAETIYVGFADYSQVAGRYNLPSIGGNETYIKLGLDGSLLYSNGALNYTSYYSYDGKNILLFDCPLLMETSTDTSGEEYSYFSSGMATLSGTTLTIVNNVTYTTSSPITATATATSFAYGSYYIDSTSRQYVFNTDGTGLYNGNSMTFTISGNTITIKLQNTSVVTGTFSGNTITLSNGSITLNHRDAFYGTWEKSASSHKQYYFDGNGNWTYTYFGYNAKGEVISLGADESGTYTYNSADNTITLSNGSVVSFDENGFIVVTTSSNFAQTYYKQSSYTGSWRFFYKKEAVDLVLGGIGSNGYGQATVVYEYGGTLAMTYDIRTVSNVDYICLFYDGVQYAQLTYDATNSTLTGSMYSYINGATISGAVFCLYDDYKGSWISSEWAQIEFNGLGAYNLGGTTATGSSTLVKVNGTVKISGITVGTYTLQNSTLSGKFTYQNVEYTISYNEEKDIIVVSSSTQSFELHRYDSWHNLTLNTTDGSQVTFNGGGTLPTGGTLTITKGESKTTYSYFVVDGGITIKDAQGSSVGSITVSDNSYVLNLSNVQSSLAVYNLFTGEWVVGGGADQKMVIGAIGADNKAQGTYLGTEVEFTYLSDTSSLSFEYNGKIYYVNSMKAGSQVELAISLNNNTLGSFTTAVKESTLDAFVGTYTASNGAKVIIDGLGNTKYGNGSVVLVNASGETIATYTYKLNALGKLEIAGTSKMSLKQVTNATSESYAKDGKNYVLTNVDVLYLATATDKTNSKLVYTFDGIGGMTSSDGHSYTYTIVSNNTVSNYYELTIVDEATRQSYKGEFDYGSSDYKLVLTQA